jgi:drug/metabolite transporter (DMT)-like permease
VTFALSAAVGWGLADFLGAMSTRRVGLLLTMCTSLLVGCAILAVTAATPVVTGIHLSGGDAVALAVSGVLGAASYAGFYRALQLGPVSLVSPIFSAYAMVAVLLAVLVGRQTLGPAAAVGVALTIGGVVLASASGSQPATPASQPATPASQPATPASQPATPAGQPETPESEPPAERRRSGVPYALAAMLAWGVTTYILARSAEHLGWFWPVAVSRVVTLAVLLAAAAAIAIRHRTAPPEPAKPEPVKPDPARPKAPRTRLWLPAASGLLDMLAFLAFARAGQTGSVSVAAAASACFPLIVIAGGVLVFKERLRPVQFAGAGLTIAGLLLLGLSQ